MNLIFAAAVAVGTITSVAVAIFFGRKQHKALQHQIDLSSHQLQASREQTFIQEFQAKQLDRNTYLASVEFALKWNEGEIVAARRRLAEQGITFSKEKVLDENDIKALSEQDRIDLRLLLNHLNLAAIGLQQGIFDEDMMYHLYGYLIVNYHEGLKHFIKVERPPAQIHGAIVAWFWLTEWAAAWEIKMAKDREKTERASKAAIDEAHALRPRVNSFKPK